VPRRFAERTDRPAEATGPDDDRVEALSLGNLGHRLGRIAGRRVDVGPEAALGQPVVRRSQGRRVRLAVVPRIDADPAAAPRRDADDPDLGVERSCELRALFKGALRRFMAVERNQDPFHARRIRPVPPPPASSRRAR
jgi:hypothetical protein